MIGNLYDKIYFDWASANHLNCYFLKIIAMVKMSEKAKITFALYYGGHRLPGENDDLQLHPWHCQY